MNIKNFALIILMFLQLSSQAQNLNPDKGQETGKDRIYPLKGLKLNKGCWILCHTEIENISKGIEITEIILDQKLLNQVANSFFIVNSRDYFDCASKTPGYRFTLYHNFKYYGAVSYCYPEQVNLGALKGKFQKAKLIRESVDLEKYTSKRDSIEKLENTITLRPKKEKGNKNGQVLVKYLEID
jgi:hypothetical protein